MRNLLCPICGAYYNYEIIYTQNFNNEGISLMPWYNVVICNECNFIYAKEIPSQLEFNNFYTNMSKWESVNIDGKAEVEYKKYFKSMVEYISPYIKNKEIKILDIGCSTGGLLNEFKLSGFNNVFGLDPSDRAISIIKELHNIDGVASDILSFSTENKFDLILITGVLEHVVDLNKLVDKVKSLLTDDGLFFVSVPDVSKFKDYIHTPFQQFSTEHINYFSKESLFTLLTQHDFSINAFLQRGYSLNKVIDPEIFVLSSKHNSKKDITEYIEKNKHMYDDVKKIIKDKLSNEKEIIVWGVGTFTLHIIDTFLESSKIRYFIDSNNKIQGKKVKDIEIRSPSSNIEKDIPIVISTNAFQNEIENEIKNVLKLDNRIIKLYE